MRKPIFPKELNRSALIIRPQKPMEDWVNSVEGKKVFDLSHAGLSVYLLPEVFDTEDASSIWQPHYKHIFEKELEGWFANRDLWPADMSLKLFKDFFEITFAGTVSDASDEPFEEYV